jgi:hypothetical protein
MYMVALGWIYVVLMMSVAEANAANGTLLGAVVTFVLYGMVPLSIVMYLLGTPARRSARRTAEAAQARSAPVDPDGGGHPPGDPVASEREEP